MTPQDLKQIGSLIDNKLEKNNKKWKKVIDGGFKEQEKKFEKKLYTQGESLKGYIDGKLVDQDSKLEFLIESKFEEHDSRLEQKLLVWKSEIIDAVDLVAKEFQSLDEFKEITTQQIVNNRERVERLEKKVFGVVGA